MIAYLILAYNQPRLLEKLVKALDYDHVHFFIHIDRKFDIEPFIQVVGNKKNVTFLEKRFEIYWGGFSQVKATLELMSVAQSRGNGFERFCRLSGGDYPIKRNETIQSFFKKYSTMEFIRVDRQISNAVKNNFSRNIEQYHFLDFRSVNPKTAKCFPYRKLINTLGKHLPKRKYPNIMPYHGSSWWCLTTDAVAYVLRYAKSNPEFVRFHQYAAVSEEIFFHSILKQSPMAKYIAQDFAMEKDFFGEKEAHGCHYIDWENGDGNSPKILDEFDYQKLVTSSMLFARKFDWEFSQRLIKNIDETILQVA